MKLGFLKKKGWIAAAALLLLIIALILLAHTRLIRSRVLGYAQNYLQKNQGIHLSVQSFKYNLLDLRFRLKGLVATSQKNPDFPPFLKADEVEIEIPLSLILGRKLRIQSLNIKNPEINIHIDHQGKNNLPFQTRRKVKEPSAKKLPELVFERFQVQSARVHFKDQQKRTEVRLSGIHIHINWQGEGKHDFLVETREEGFLSYQNIRYPLSDLNLKAEIGYEGAGLKEFRFLLGKSEFHLAGRVDDFFQPRLDTRIKCQLDAEDLSSAFSLERSFTGRLKLDSYVQGPLSSLDARLQIQGDALSFGELKDTALKTDLAWKNQILSVSSLHMAAAGGEVELDGKIQIRSGRLSGGFELKTHKIKELAARIASFSQSLSGMDILKSDMDGRVVVSGRLEGSTKAPRVEMKIRGRELGFRELQNLTLDGRVVYDTDSLRVDFLRVAEKEAYPENGIRISGLYPLKDSSRPLRFDASGKKLSLRRILKGLGSDVQVEAVADFELEGRGTFDSPRITAHALLKDAVYGTRSIGELKIQARSSGGKLDFEVLAPSYSFAGQGSLDLSSPYPVEAELILDDLAVEKIRSLMLFDKEWDISGNLKARTRVKMEALNPVKTLCFEFQAEELSLKRGPHELRNKGPVILSYDEGGISIQNLVLTGTGARIQAEGALPAESYSSSGIRLDAEVDLSYVSLFLPDIQAQGILKLNARAQGSASDMELAAEIGLSDSTLALAEIPSPFEDIRLRARAAKNMMTVESLSFRLGKGRYELQGAFPLESFMMSPEEAERGFEKEPVNLKLTLQNFDPSLLKDISGADILQEMGGKIDGKIEIRGKRLRLNDLSASASLDTLELDFLGLSFNQDAPAQIQMKEGRVEIQNLALSHGENRLSVQGSADFVQAEFLDLFVEGRVDLKILGAIVGEGFFSGAAEFRIGLAGRFTDPQMHGFISLEQGSLQILYPRILLSQVEGRMELDRRQVNLEKIQGRLNGGTLELNGDIGLEEWKFSRARVDLNIQNSLFDFPRDLQSQVSSDLVFESNGKKHSLNGRLTIIDAKYTEPFSVESTVFHLLRRGTPVRSFRQPSPFLSQFYWNITVSTRNALLIDNNISRSGLTADLKLGGTFYNPALAGRVEFEEGGEIYFSQNTFVVEQGTVDFIHPTRIEPDLNLSARTQVSGYDIRLLLSGTPDKLSASFTSDPPLSEPNIISLLVTGRTLESASASVLDVAGSKALSYLNNAFTGRIEKALARSLGLESVRIDASLVSTEENPGARITVGQHLARSFELVFSQDLKDAHNRTWIANYNPRQNVNLQGVKRDDNEFNFALRHELKFGLEEEKSMPLSGLRREVLRVGRIEVEGRVGLEEGKVRRQIKLREGKRFDFLKFRKSLERLRRLYRKNSYLSFSVNPLREEKNGRVKVIFQIQAGPRIFLKYQGAAVPGKIKKEIIHTWFGSSFGELAREAIKQRLRVYLIKKKYYQGAVHAREQEHTEEERVILFVMDRGIRYDAVNITYSGSRALSSDRLTSFLKKSGLLSDIFVNPRKAARSIEELYSQEGYLSAEVESPLVRFRPQRKRVDVHFRLQEGPRFQVGETEFNGARFFDRERLIQEIGMHPGDVISPQKYNEAPQKIRDAYARKGFNQVVVRFRIEVHEREGLVDLIFDIQENQQGKIARIQVSGDSLTRKKVILREMMFKQGDMVDFHLINQTRKRLYDLGIFERVNIEVVPVEKEGLAYPAGESGRSDSVAFYRVEIEVAELKPYRLRYGVQYDTESSVGISGGLVNRNVLGNAHLVGASFRLNRDERDVRGFFRTPYFFSRKINTEFFTFFNRTIKPSFTVDRTGITFQQQVEFAKSYILSYNSTIERHHTFDERFDADSGLDTAVNVGVLNAALTRDTRDNILDARRGIFFSQNVGYAPGLFGSEARFIRYFGQYFAYKKVADFLVYASGIRVGIARGLGQDLIPSERFFAGGGTTLRGFEKDSLGPRNPSTGLPEGGEAVFILNQELRFPLYRKLSGAVFLDLGNVYARVSDFDPFEVRKAAGFGLRFDTPFALVRFDWGFKLDRRPGESLSRIFFSIGQAF
ncbi:MAG: outer membrane protein assembly factor BamA [Candidatus Aminicenantes bacterium]